MRLPVNIDPAVQQDLTETRNTLLDRLSEHIALGAFIRARFGGTCFYRLACRDCKKAADSSSLVACRRRPSGASYNGASTFVQETVP